MYCAQCGTSNADSSKICVKCGSALIQRPAELAPLEPPRTGLMSSGAPAATTITLYGGFWRRVAAYLIDNFICFVALLVIAIATGEMSQPEGHSSRVFLISVVLVPWLYTAILESGSRQATLGKLAVGIKVTDLAGNRISFARASGRYFAEWINSFTLGIGYLLAAFTRRRQSLHDIIASTVVVYANVEPFPVTGAPIAKAIPAWAIVFIVLVGMVPVLGIMAAIAIPAYQDYTIRSQVEEGLMIAHNYKLSVAHALSNGADFDEIDSATIERPIQTEGHYVQGIDVISGTISVTYGKGAHARLSGRVLTLVPAFDSADNLIWICGYAPSPAGATVIFENHTEFSDVAERYVPAACR